MLQRLIRFVHEYSPDVILALMAIAIFVLTPRFLGQIFYDDESHKSVDIALKMLGTLIAVAASIASYRRFFRGRIFAPRLRIALSSRAICELSDGTILHSVDIEVENIGGITVWNLAVILRVLELDADLDCTVSGITTEGIEQPLRPGGIEGIEPGELVVYHYRCRIPASIEAFRILVELSMDRRHAWHRSITVANVAESSRNPAKAANS